MEQADNSVNRRRARGGVQVGARACTVQPGIRSSQRVATAPRPVRNFYYVGRVCVGRFPRAPTGADPRVGLLNVGDCTVLKC